VNSETIRALESMPDDAKFEHLVMAILRRSEQKYRGLVHTGINSQGKTVKSPVDGILINNSCDPPHFVIAHHTTTNRDKLRKKWLHKGTKKTPEGDIVKSIKLVGQERLRNPEFKYTLILSTNKIPDVDLVRDTYSETQKAGIELDLWDLTRLSNFLDNETEGQWLRWKYLGINQEQLSKDLLKELGQKSLDSISIFDSPDTWIDRQLDSQLAKRMEQRTNSIFLVGSSGLGKSSACFKLLKRHIAEIGIGICLPHYVIEKSSTLTFAIEEVLHQLHPTLEKGAGVKALDLATESSPFLVIIEDINKSMQPATTLERVLKWLNLESDHSKRAEASTRSNLCIICPIWPQVLSSLSEESRELIERKALYAQAFTTEEATKAILRRLQETEPTTSFLRARAIAEAFGCDPLLIALGASLNTESYTSPTAVILKYVDSHIEKVSSRSQSFLASEFKATFHALALKMLAHKIFSPSWSTITAWFQTDQQHIVILRQLINDRELCRLEDVKGESLIVFRHDRVRNTILSDALAFAMDQNQVPPGCLDDPFFSEIAGSALLNSKAPELWIDKLRKVNPLALFYAFKQFAEPTQSIHRSIISAILNWLKNPVTHTAANQHLRWETQQVLSEIDSSYVPTFCDKFNDRTWSLLEAKIRNGDLFAATSYCFSLEPSTNFARRDHFIAHFASRLDQAGVQKLSFIIEDSNSPEKLWIGALRLIGFMSDKRFLQSIKQRWNTTALKNDPSHVSEFLWTALRCVVDQALLNSIMKAWEKLPDEAGEGGRIPPRHEVVQEIQLKTQRGLPEQSIQYLLSKADAHTMRGDIFQMLSYVDHPDVIELIARYTAEVDQKVAEGNSINVFRWGLVDRWDTTTRNGKSMSSSSRQRLEAIWRSDIEGTYTRKAAFDLWGASSTFRELAELQNIEEGTVLSENAIKLRLKHGDKSAIPLLLQKLEKAQFRSYWWQFCRHIWNEDLTQALDKELERRSNVVIKNWGDNDFETDWIARDLICRLKSSTAEKLLEKHWKHLHFNSCFVQAALFHATPKTIELACNSLQESPNPKELLTHIGSRLGLQVEDSPRITSIKTLIALLPYIDLVDEMGIYDLWNLCNQQGWYDWRRDHLDQRLSQTWRKRCGIDESLLFEELDEYASDSKPITWIDVWISQFAERGESHNRLIEVIQAWLKEQHSIKALKVVAKILAYSGNRADLTLLENANIQPTSEADEIRKDTKFAVSRRTLI
jgi:hypothetical protein